MKVTRLSYFLIVWLLCIISFLMVLPFQALVTNKPLMLTGVQLLWKTMQVAVVYGLMICIGAVLSIRQGIKFLFLEHIFAIGQLLGPGLLAGFLCATFLVVTDLFIFHSLSPSTHAITIHPLYGLGGAFYGALNEEVNLRLFFCSLIASVGALIFKNRYRTGIIWMSIVVSSIIFGLGHLQAVTAPLTPLLFTKIVMLNSVAGIIFGWLFWYKGFEVAVCAHFVTDIILFVVVPLLQAMF